MIENLVIDDLRLFLDERPTRYARNSKLGLKILHDVRSEGVAKLWLDHDLGKVYPSESAAYNTVTPASSFGAVEKETIIVDPQMKIIDDVQPIVRFLENHKRDTGSLYPVESIYVHTSNSVERVKMHERLVKAGYPHVEMILNHEDIFRVLERLFED